MKLGWNIAIIAAAIALLFVAGCTAQQSQPISYKLITDREEAVSQSSTEVCKIVDYGRGVLFFECNGDAFAQALSGYLGEHIVRVDAITPVPYPTSYNSFQGYIVVVR